MRGLLIFGCIAAIILVLVNESQAQHGVGGGYYPGHPGSGARPGGGSGRYPRPGGGGGRYPGGGNGGGRRPCICGAIYSPVCGSNGRTYPNRCQLNCESRYDRYLRVAYSGNCGRRG